MQLDPELKIPENTDLPKYFPAENCFLAKYVTDCIRENCILPNLSDYRIKWDFNGLIASTIICFQVEGTFLIFNESPGGFAGTNNLGSCLC